MSINDIASVINNLWIKLKINDSFRTPDNQNGKQFRIKTRGTHHIVITTNDGNGSDVKITQDAFITTLDYLVTHKHRENNKCEIDSNNNPRLSGPLCTTSRQENNNIRCINYILPILKKFNLVDIDGRRKNTTWLI